MFDHDDLTVIVGLVVALIVLALCVVSIAAILGLAVVVFRLVSG